MLQFYSSVLKSFSVSLFQSICSKMSLFLHLIAEVSVVQYFCVICAFCLAEAVGSATSFLAQHGSEAFVYSLMDDSLCCYC